MRARAFILCAVIASMALATVAPAGALPGRRQLPFEGLRPDRGVRAQAGAAAPAYKVVAEGLNNPRGLTFGRRGALYVAESGFGGRHTCIEEFGEEICFGFTGSITRVKGGMQERIVRGLPSIGGGGLGIGPHDVSIGPRGVGWVAIGLFASAEIRAAFGPAARRMGSLASFNRRGRVRYHADLAAYEAANNVDDYAVECGDERFVDLDSNPYAVLREAHRTLVVDAGGNDVFKVGRPGRVRPVAVFPTRDITIPECPDPIPSQSVPTSIVKGPDGAYYVGELAEGTGPGSARVFRFVRGRKPTVYARGFSFIADIAFGHDGSLYVLQPVTDEGSPESGQITRLAPDGSREVVATQGLVFPLGMAVGPDGDLYVTNFSNFSPGQGQVLRIPAPA